MNKTPECGVCGAWIIPPRQTICADCEGKVNRYADAMILRDKINGPQTRIQDERSPDGRSLLAEMNGDLTRSTIEKAPE